MEETFAGENFIPLQEGFKVNVRRVGTGEVKLLTLHGGPGLTHECFANFPENLNPYGVQVIFYNQLGSFYSDQPDDRRLWNMPRFVEELQQVIKELELDNCFVFAHSWGAMLLIDYLLKYETHFKGIIISGMSASFRKFKENITELRKQLPKEVLQELESLEKQGQEKSAAYQQLVFEHWLNLHYCSLKPWPEPLRQSWEHLSNPVLHELLGSNPFNYNGSASHWDRSDELEKIKIPALVVGGKADLVFEEDLKFMANQLQRGEYRVLPGEGHFCWWSEEKAFFETLRKFIAQHS